MKTGETSKLLDTTKETLGNWVKHPLLEEFFSPGARLKTGSAYRDFNRDDLLALATIKHLRHVERVGEWQQIADRLATGERVDIPELATVRTAHTTTTTRHVAPSALDILSQQVAQLRRELTEQRDKYEAKIDKLHAEIARLNRVIGALEGSDTP